MKKISPSISPGVEAPLADTSASSTNTRFSSFLNRGSRSELSDHPHITPTCNTSEYYTQKEFQTIPTSFTTGICDFEISGEITHEIQE